LMIWNSLFCAVSQENTKIRLFLFLFRDRLIKKDNLVGYGG
jgi:hypothetical protein